jgi:uncharacterized protein (DUF427 family)
MNRPKPDAPAPGQESVWNFPRPSVAQAIDAHLRVVLAGRVIAETRRGVRTIETSHPPTYYFPPDDIEDGVLIRAMGSSLCEWKGAAIYYNVAAGETVRRKAAWAYSNPTHAFLMIRDHVAFYAEAMDACFVDGERVVQIVGLETPFFKRPR